jgi:hypothetical protein
VRISNKQGLIDHRINILQDMVEELVKAVCIIIICVVYLLVLLADLEGDVDYREYSLPFEGRYLPKIPSVEKTKSGTVENEGIRVDEMKEFHFFHYLPTLFSCLWEKVWVVYRSH